MKIILIFQKVNEQSLKLLHSNVQSIENGISIGETSLTFFKKIPGLLLLLFYNLSICIMF